MATITEAAPNQAVSSHDGKPATSWFAVVGFDGTKPSQAALDVATKLVRERNGHLELVYVAHLPAYAAMSAPVIVAINEGFPEIASELIVTAHAALDGGEADWHFQQRNGSVASELLAAATELRARNGIDAMIVIIVGSSQHRLHRTTRSAAASLLQESEFPLLMVPPPRNGETS